MRRPPSPRLIARFVCDVTLNVLAVEGPTLADLLGTDPSALLGMGWFRYLPHDDYDEAFRLASDLKLNLPGQYRVRNVGRGGHTLHLCVKTLVLHKADGSTHTGGFTALEALESPRTLFDLARDVYVARRP